MSAHVNLLLLLSALLSALTGVGGNVRQPPVAQAVAQQARVAATVSVRHAIGVRPIQAIASLPTLAAAPVTQVFALSAIEPPYALRRRE